MQRDNPAIPDIKQKVPDVVKTRIVDGLVNECMVSLKKIAKYTNYPTKILMSIAIKIATPDICEEFLPGQYRIHNPLNLIVPELGVDVHVPREIYSSQNTWLIRGVEHIFRCIWLDDKKYSRVNFPAVITMFPESIVKEWFMNGVPYRAFDEATKEVYSKNELCAKLWVHKGIYSRQDPSEPAIKTYYPGTNILHSEIWLTNGHYFREQKPVRVVYTRTGEKYAEIWYDRKFYRENTKNRPINVAIHPYIEIDRICNMSWRRSPKNPSVIIYNEKKIIEFYYTNGKPYNKNHPICIEKERETCNKLMEIWCTERNNIPFAYVDAPGVIEQRFYRKDAPAMIDYHPNGNIRSETWFTNQHDTMIAHRTDGPANIIYNENGTLKSETWCMNGSNYRVGGPFLTNYNNGVLAEQWWRERIFSKTPKLSVNATSYRISGPACVRYHPNGSVRQEIWIDNGKIHRFDGPAVIQYKEDGTVEGKMHYINGVIVGDPEEPSYKKQKK